MNRIVFIGVVQITLLVCLHFTALCAPMDVFVSIPPQKWLCDQVGGKLVTTHVLVGKGQNPHTFEPTPRQVIALSRAKLFFTVGMTFEEKISHKLERVSGSLNRIDISRHVHKIPMGKDGHNHEEDHRHGQDIQKDDHGHEILDPHIWLSPVNLKLMAANMADAMIDIDPANKSEYERNLLNVTSRLDRLHTTIKRELAPYKGASVYVFHPAFGYFAHAYHLRQEAVEIEGKTPTPKQLASLITRAKSRGVKVIFVQPQFDPKSAAAIASAIGGKVIPLNPLAEDVEANLKLMAGKIKEALSTQYKRRP